MQNILNLVNEAIQIIPNSRTKEVIVRRFGLKDGKRHTLEAIGNDHGITRERVRQIEEGGLATLKQAKIMDKFQPVFKTVENHMKEHGELKKEHKLYDDLTYVCFPVKEIERMKKEGDLSVLDKCHSAFYFIMSLGNKFERLPESDQFYSVWTSSKNSVKTAKKTVDSLAKHMEGKKQVLSKEELLSAAKVLFPELSPKAVHSYVDASKNIEQNHLGHFGLVHWPEISPRGVKDKAYIVLKNAGKPLHFSEVTAEINKVLPSGRQAYMQTVHNELIKDKRFVLVGRGLYALAEWGYEPGTVAQTIVQLLKKENRPLSKEEIVKNVLAKRLVKENTILINLQNRKIFSRTDSGTYLLKK
ncbi:MAG: HTH domain-containing protein [Candidatus Portnoybacteria bacterium]|nr:HTH domain-containing protein [Candidatus Portnoybacteria bacterium]MDD4982437.1 HTH domain-containing protein [Candidatus Portnoybacteria bacterium]